MANPTQKNAGFTLLEVTIAVAIFAAVIGVTAQSLMSFYVTLDMQEQRVEAINACRSVMGAIREKRNELSDNFPADLIDWASEMNESHWDSYYNPAPDTGSLKNFAIAFSAKNLDGEDATDGDNPIQIQVEATWLDPRGRPLAVSVASIITDQ